MNYVFRIIVICACFIYNSAILTGTRVLEKNSAATRNTPAQIVYVPVPVSNTPQKPLDPVEQDKIIDHALFGHFVSILGHFGKILLDPHDKQNVTVQVAHMVDNIIAVAQTVTRALNCPEKQAAISMRKLLKFLVCNHQTVHAQRTSLLSTPPSDN